MQKSTVYRIGAYGVYPVLVAVGGELLSFETSRWGVAAASVLLASGVVLLAALGHYCGRCAERLIPRLLRLMAMPAAVLTALAARSAQGGRQLIAFGLIGASIVIFSLAWRWASEAPVHPGGQQW